jgi:hypothetical protein
VGARGPEPSGSIRVSVRLRPELIARLKGAVAKKGKNVSREIENRLNRSFADELTVAKQFGDRQIMAVARMVFAAARATVTVNGKSGKTNWLNDRAAFEAAVTAINRVFELIGPAVGKPESLPGGIEPASDDAVDRPGGPTYLPALNAEALVREIAMAPLVAPARASRHVLATVALRKDLGDAVLDRAGGVRARAWSTWAKEYGGLRRKQAKAPDSMTNAELQRMKALLAERERLLRHRH